MNVDLNEIKNHIVSFCSAAAEKIVEWSGHVVTLLKSGTYAALPYLQNKWLAAISLIAVTLLLIEVGHLFNSILSYFNSKPKDGEEGYPFTNRVRLCIGTSVVTAGVAAFSIAAKLPLQWYVIAGITAATAIILRAPWS